MNIISLHCNILKLIDKNYWSLSLTWCRVFLAVSLLLNLIFNSNETLLINPKKNISFENPEFYSLYTIFDHQIAKYISISILFVVISGFFIKATSILHFWVAFSFNVSAKLLEGGDQVVLIYSFLLIPILLMDNRKNHWVESKATEIAFNKKTIAFCTVLLMKIQFFVIYFIAAVSKFNHKEWYNGTALYYWFNDKVFGLNSIYLSIFNPLLKNSFFIVAITWGTLLVELLIAYSAFSKNPTYKTVCFVLGFSLHFGIALLLGLWSFFFAMLAILTYILLDLNKVKFYNEKILSKL